MKLAIAFCFVILSSCMATKQTPSQRTFQVTGIEEQQNGFRLVKLTDVKTLRHYSTTCTCDTLKVGLVFTANLIIPIK